MEAILDWIRRAPGRGIAAGLGLVLLGSLGYVLPPHWVVLPVVGGVAGTLIFAYAVSKLAGQGLAAVALFGGVFLSVTFGLLVNRVALAAFGHEVRCPVADRETLDDQDSGSYYRYTVDCPDGRYTFDAATNIDVADVENTVVMVSALGDVIERRPRALVADRAGWFYLTPPPVVVLAVVGAAFALRRR